MTQPQDPDRPFEHEPESSDGLDPMVEEGAPEGVPLEAQSDAPSDPLIGEELREDEDEALEDDFETILEDGEEDSGKPAWARRRWSLVTVILAAVAGGLVVALATWTWPSVDSGRVVAEVEMVRTGSGTGTAVATISENDDGRVLRIHTEEFPDIADAYIQVWLTNPAEDAYYAVGVLTTERGEFGLPSTLDLSKYPSIELAEEILDGDPGHGGRVQWRGDWPQQQSSR